MKNNILRLVFLSTFLPVLAFAQVISDDSVDQIDCTIITHALKLGSKDSNTGGDVTTLQIYLSQANFLDSDPTGYFGKATKKAVQDFQRANGIAPQGNVGPATRLKIKGSSCTDSNNTNTSVNTPTNSRAVAVNNNHSDINNSLPKITVLSPKGGEKVRRLVHEPTTLVVTWKTENIPSDKLMFVNLRNTETNQQYALTSSKVSDKRSTLLNSIGVINDGKEEFWLDREVPSGKYLVEVKTANNTGSGSNVVTYTTGVSAAPFYFLGSDGKTTGYKKLLDFLEPSLTTPEIIIGKNGSSFELIPKWILASGVKETFPQNGEGLTATVIEMHLECDGSYINFNDNASPISKSVRSTSISNDVISSIKSRHLSGGDCKLVATLSYVPQLAICDQQRNNGKLTSSADSCYRKEDNLSDEARQYYSESPHFKIKVIDGIGDN